MTLQQVQGERNNPQERDNPQEKGNMIVRVDIAGGVVYISSQPDFGLVEGLLP